MPHTTVVTPWLRFIAMVGLSIRAVSSWVCTSMKPGATTLPVRRSRVALGVPALDGGDAVAFEGDVGGEQLLAGAVGHLAVADDDVVSGHDKTP